ncbi:MAG: choice-of-anchor J domain-containing protein [Candidatus Syntrophosphaera sp.]
MKTGMQKIVLLFVFSVLAFGAWAVVSEYSFASTTGTYTEITGGTVLGTTANDDESFNAIPLGFTFTYNEVDHTEISVQTDAFVALGSTVDNSTLAISSESGTNNIVAALNRDLISRDDGELMYLLSGTAPNRVFTVQWKNYRRWPTPAANDVFNFQIQFHEGSNEVVFAYGAFTAVNVITARTVQVGLRGDSNQDFNNRTTTTDWTATEAGTTNNANCHLTSTVFPPDGLTFTFSPPQQGEPPLPAVNPVPAHDALDVAIGTNLSWVTGGGVVDGYKVYFGTDSPPTNLVNGTIQTETVYDHASDLIYSTDYYWQIVPFNTFGDAANCPIWHFTTLDDPTVTEYPHVENFDNVTPPALPLGWSTINANQDSYTWETYAGNADTAPNSVRIRYNTALAMDDWLISLPLQLTADTPYELTFSYRANSSNYPEALSVYWGASPDGASLTNLLFENENITNTTYTQESVLFDVTTTGTYYIGFHGYSDADMFYLYMDSITIDEMIEDLDPPTNLAAEVVDNNDVHLTWDAPGDTPPPPPGFDDGFETYTDFSLAFDPWVLVDVDQSGTYGMTGITWPNAYSAMAYMIFNPGATTPPVTDAAPHGGAKMAACFASTTPPNNDWMISPPITPEAGQFLNFYAKSYTDQYGLERFKVGISSGGTTPADFTIISGTNYVQAPTDWTNYSYDLSSYAGQSIRFAIQCVSNDAFIFFVDDVSVGDVPVRMDAPIAFEQNSGTIARNTGIPVPGPEVVNPPSRELFGYKVYRDGNLIGTINDPATLAYDDMDLDVGTYSYTVTAFYTSGESDPAGPVTVEITPPLNPPTDLIATVDGNDVTLDWVSPEPPPTGDWITWCNDVLGNSVGTNAAAVFDVAHRFDQTDLASHQGNLISQVKFVPAYADCVYTVKVWTGGSASGAGTLVSSQIVDNIILDEWNLCVLNTPVPVPSTGDLYVGYECDTQGGYPAGCDNGPHIDGKGNMMYYQGTWDTLVNLAPTLTYNWLIQTFIQEVPVLKAVELTPIPQNRAISYSKAPLGLQTKEISRENDRALTGFKVYRDDVLISTISDPLTTTYTDMDLANGDYVYGVSATYTTGESVPAEVNVTVNVQLAEIIFEDGYEDYDDFVMTFAPWTLLDIDQSTTWGITGVSFPGSESAMAYIIFNPSQTVPPLTSLTPYGGAKVASCFAATAPPNNDWMVAPRVHLGTDSSLKFYAKSQMADYGLERFRVGVSTLSTIIPQGFQYVSGPDFVEAPVNWSEFVYDLSAYDNQSVFIAIRCVSNDAFIFHVDDFTIHSDGGYVDGNDPGAPALVTQLKGNYPNPFNPETTIRFSLKEAAPVNIGIYNVKGQLVRTLVNAEKTSGNHSVVWNGRDDNGSSVSSGVYFYKMNAGKYSSTRKMILMK